MHEVHYAMVVVLAMGIGLFAPPFGVGYYAACAISRIHPDEGMKPIIGYMLALAHRHHHRRRHPLDLHRLLVTADWIGARLLFIRVRPTRSGVEQA